MEKILVPCDCRACREHYESELTYEPMPSRGSVDREAYLKGIFRYMPVETDSLVPDQN